MAGMTDDDNDASLESAAAALAAAQEAVHAARRDLSRAVTAAYRAGIPAARIAERTGMDTVSVRNLLAATGTTSRRT